MPNFDRQSPSTLKAIIQAPVWMMALGLAPSLVSLLLLPSLTGLVCQLTLFLVFLGMSPFTYEKPWSNELSTLKLDRSLWALIVFIQIFYLIGMGIASLYGVPAHPWGLFTGLMALIIYQTSLPMGNGHAETIVVGVFSLILACLSLSIADFVSHGYLQTHFPGFMAGLRWALFALMSAGIFIIVLMIKDSLTTTSYFRGAIVGLYTLGGAATWLFYPPHGLVIFALLTTTAGALGLADIAWLNQAFGKLFMKLTTPAISQAQTDALLAKSLLALMDTDIEKDRDNPITLIINSPKNWMMKNDLSLRRDKTLSDDWKLMRAIADTLSPSIHGISFEEKSVQGNLPQSAHERMALMETASPGS